MRRRRFSPQVYAEIIWRQNFCCGCGCGEPRGDDPRLIQYDHILPLADGGTDTPDNLQAIIKGRGHHGDKTIRECKARAKVRRIQQTRGMTLPKMSKRDKVLAKMLEERG